MFLIAMRCLLHERGKLAAAVAGVAFASGLVLGQSGRYMGYVQKTASIIPYVGADLWVMARGTHLLDHADNLSAGARGAIAAQPCVKAARGVVFAWAPAQLRSGAIDMTQIVAVEPGGSHVVPWTMTDGLPSDLVGPMRVAIDRADLDRLEIAAPVMGAELNVLGRTTYVSAVTTGTRSFTVAPYIFADVRTAQRLVGLGEEQFTFWAVDLAAPDCRATVKASIEQNPGLQVLTSAEFAGMTSRVWLKNAGIGTLLTFGAVLGLIVGASVVGHTLFGVIENHQRELATLKVMGASTRELVAFVLWQAAFFACAGQAFGILIAMGFRRLSEREGLILLLSPGVLAFGFACTLAMCLLASILSVRKLLRTEAAEVFR